MAHQTLRRVLPQLLRFLDAQPGRKQTDGCLLEQFITQRDEGVFALLVERHGPMVLSVCRRVLGDAHEAEDAFQATFLVLALRANAVRRRESLGSWLYGVARRVAAKARAQSARRRVREASAAALILVTSSPAAEWTEFRGVLDEELSRLPELYRRPFVLCCLEEKTQEQAAAEIGCPRSSLASRLARAKEILRRQLTDRGVCPAGLTAIAVRTACAAVHGSGATATTPARVLALAHGAMKALSATHIVVILSLTLFAGAGVVAAGALAPPAKGDKPATPPVAAPVAADAPEAERTDRYGDPLPPGALMRLGTVRFRHGGNGLNDAVYSPDGKILATAGELGRIHLWDAATGKEIAVLEGDKKTCLLSLAFSPDGKTLAAGGISFDLPRHEGARLPSKLTLWDMATRKSRLFFENEHEAATGYQHGFDRITYSPDGKWLAAGCDGSIRLWEVATAKEAPPILAKDDTIIALVFSPDSHTLAWGGFIGGDAVMWDMATRKEVRRLGGHKCSLRQLAYSPDGKLLAAAYDDKTIGLWDSATGQEVRRLKGHESAVVSIAFSPDGKTLASAANATEPVRLWDSATGDVRFQLRVPKIFDNFARVVFSPDGTTLAVAHQDGTVFLWNPATGKRLLAADEHEFMVSGIDLSPDGRTLATAGPVDKAIRLWDLATGRHIRTLSPARGVWFPAFSPDGAHISTVLISGPPTVWETATGRELPALPIAADARTLTLNGTLMSVEGTDETLRLLETATGKELQTFKGIGKQLHGVHLSPDGKTLATGTFPEWTGRQDEKGRRIYKDAPTIRLWNVATGQETHRIGGSKTNGVVFSPDGRTAALTDPGHVRFWDVGSGQQLRDLSQAETGSCRFSPDGRMLATFDSTHSGVHIWELATGRERLRLAGHSEGTSCVLFTPDGRTLITGGMDSTVLVWNLAPARPDAEKLDRLWSKLGDDDVGHAYEAIWALSMSPETVGFLKARLKPASGAEATQIHRLIADLDNDDFNAREKASADLARIGAGAEDAFLDTLAGKPSPEVGRRVQILREALQRHPARLPAEKLQGLRALEVLERIGSPEARRVLETLAGGGEDRLTHEAKASLTRLKKTAAADAPSP